MIPRPSRDHILLVFATGLGVLSFWLFIAPDTIPVSLDALNVIVEDLSPTTVAGFLAGILLLVAIIRLLRGNNGELDRTAIMETPPENPSETPVPEATIALETIWRVTDEWFDTPGAAERRIAMYGRRATELEDIPDSLEHLLDELAVTARDTYATSARVSTDEAETAVATGTWTDDRVAAAFLASEIDADVTFTTTERAIGWLAPRRTFESRLERAVAAIETLGNAYVTYDSSRDSETVASGDTILSDGGESNA